MKFVNDKGLSTPERLYAIGDMLKANFRWLVYNSEIPKPNFAYSISLLSAGDGKTYSFAEAEQVSIGQSVLWCVNEDIYLAIISSFDLEKEQITLGGVTRWQGEQGQTGENGKEPLLYTTVYSSATKVTMGSPYELSYIYFSRKPDVYEFFSGLIMTWEDTSSTPSITRTYECIAKVMSVNSPSTVRIQITGVVETTGQTGAKGEQGEPGTGAQLYEHNIIITNTSPTATVYLTLITNSATQLNRDTLHNYFAIGPRCCSGMYYLAGAQEMPYPFISISYSNGSYKANYINFANNRIDVYEYVLTNMSMTDQVRTL